MYSLSQYTQFSHYMTRKGIHPNLYILLLLLAAYCVICVAMMLTNNYLDLSDLSFFLYNI